MPPKGKKRKAEEEGPKDSGEREDQPVAEPPPAKRGRGRPKKTEATASKGGETKQGAEGEEKPSPAKKERGKSKKVEEKPLTEEMTDSGQSETVKKGPGPKKVKSTDSGESASKPKATNVTDWSKVDLSKWSNLGTTKDGRPWTKKFSSWNVNGIRAWMKNGGMEYIKKEEPDIFTVQETKCADAELPKAELEVPGYHVYWYSAEKRGYSGTGLYTKVKPLNVTFGMGIEKHDKEGRLITAEFDKFYFITTYVPNAGEGLKRLDYRQVWDVDFRAYLKRLDAVKPVILTGDLNVAHKEIDLANPKTNMNTAGFTKEEREGFSALLAEGFLDSFRLLYPEKVAYSYWSYRFNARARNIGWRLDYFVISERLRKDLCDCVTRAEVYGSDHCPLVLGIALD